MPREGTFRYQVRAECDLSAALELLSDPSRQRELHPLMVRVVDLPTTAGALRSYAITDRLAWGPLRFPVTYRADVLVVSDHEVVTEARQSPRTTVRNHTRLRRDGSVVQADVEITLTAPKPLFGYAFRQAHAAHLALGGRIRIALESPH